MPVLQDLVEDVWKYNAYLLGLSGRCYLKLRMIAIVF